MTTTHPLLTTLKSDDFCISLMCVSNWNAWHGILGRNETVAGIRAAYLSGEITEKEIRDFVEGLEQDFHKGYHFAWEVPLAAIVVSMEEVYDDFAEECIGDLAKIHAGEVIMSTGVARRVMEKRYEKQTGQEATKGSCGQEDEAKDGSGSVEETESGHQATD